MSEPDLDAMLDDALDDLGEQEDGHAVVKDAVDKRVETLAEEMTGGAASSDPELQNLQNMFSTLASALQNPDALESSDGISKLQRTLNGTIAQLSSDPNATEEEKAELLRCAGLVDNLGKEDQEMSPEDSARAQEAIADMMKNMGNMRPGGAATGAGAGGADGAAAAGTEDGQPPAELDQLLKMMEEFHKTAAEQPQGGEGGAPGPADAEAHAQLLQALEALKGATGADAAGADGPAQAQPGNADTAAFQIVAQMWSDPAFAEPFRAMCAKFPAYLDESKGKITDAEHARFAAQHKGMCRVVELLSTGPVVDPSVPAEETAAKFGAISEALEELQALGAPPSELVQQSEA